MNADNTTSVKLKTVIVQEVAKHKEKTGLPIATFINRATEEKLKRIKSKKKV
jgi:hypothetical protein